MSTIKEKAEELGRRLEGLDRNESAVDDMVEVLCEAKKQRTQMTGNRVVLIWNDIERIHIWSGEVGNDVLETLSRFNGKYINSVYLSNEEQDVFCEFAYDSDGKVRFEEYGLVKIELPFSTGNHSVTIFECGFLP